MAQVGTVEAAWRAVLQDHHRLRSTPALGAVAPPQRLDDDKPGRGRGSCEGRHTGVIPADEPGTT
ncbi:hypothetical protein GCM10010251_80140 [Streptomyces aurantiogriseus]|uniref:Uncharacterized protein n=1 Tax=Streptomyces aurantiogriseus TaxID=66870 RepID=A0A918FLN1_9ACTN|nr:hypothetical protein GCM10010251_80140 [Streptomyces aurantiogriseus]